MSHGAGRSTSSKVFRRYLLFKINLHSNYSLPIGAAAIIVLFFFLKMPMPTQSLAEKLKRVDYVGMLFLLLEIGK
jgi:hypothetical protein